MIDFLAKALDGYFDVGGNYDTTPEQRQIAEHIVRNLGDARIIGLGLLVRARAALDLMPVRKEIKDELDALIAGDAS